MKKLILLIAMVSVRLTLGDYVRCLGGGDGGGVPFSEVLSGISQATYWVKTKHTMTDFIFWENSERIVYTNEKGQVHQHTLKENKEDALLVTNAPSRLSKIIDPLNNYFTSCSVGFTRYLMNTGKKEPSAITYKEIPRELFWNENVLYSTPETGVSEAYLSRITAFNAQTGKFSACNVNHLNKKVGISKANYFPYIYLYHQTSDYAGGLAYTAYRVDVRPALVGGECVIETFQPYYERIPGPITEMHMYPESSMLFKIKHQSKQLFWKGDGECAFYDTSGSEFTFLDANTPSAAVWNEKEGLSILNPRKAKRLKIPNVGQYRLTERDFAVSKNGKRLFVSQRPEPNAENSKVLFQFPLEGNE